MTSKKLIVVYFSFSGNTQYMVKQLSFPEGTEFVEISPRPKDYDFNFNDYEKVIIATSTLGRGEVPPALRRILPQLNKMEGRDVFLFGSGNRTYPDYCGALDVLSRGVRRQNNLKGLFRFEETPRDEVVAELQELLNPFFNSDTST